MRNWLINTEKKETEFYKGIQMHADTGMHEQAAALFRRHVPAGSTVLDVGAGAFSQRLRDLGYRVVESRDGGYLPVFDLTALRPVFRCVALNVLSGLTFLIARGPKHGWCLSFVPQRPVG